MSTPIKIQNNSIAEKYFCVYTSVQSKSNTVMPSLLLNVSAKQKKTLHHYQTSTLYLVYKRSWLNITFVQFLHVFTSLERTNHEKEKCEEYIRSQSQKTYTIITQESVRKRSSKILLGYPQRNFYIFLKHARIGISRQFVFLTQWDQSWVSIFK